MHDLPKVPSLNVGFAFNARLALPILCMSALSCGAALAQSGAPPVPSGPISSNSEIAQKYGKLPLSFEANQGQTDAKVKFLSHGDGYSLSLTDSAAVLRLSKANSAVGKAPKTDIVRMELAGGAPGVVVSGAEKLPGIVNYFPASDPKSWHTNIPTYARVQYAGVYPGSTWLTTATRSSWNTTSSLLPAPAPRQSSCTSRARRNLG